MTKVAECVDRIRRLAKIAREIDKSLDELHGIDSELGLVFGTPETMARMGDTNIALLRLEQYLNSLDLQTLRRIEALMYAGRDLEAPTAALKKGLQLPHESKEDVVRTIMEKYMNHDAYFEEGLKRAREQNVDLDTF